MVLTVTLNPAIDYVVRLDTLKPGVVNRTVGETIQFGGKGLNVSAVLHRLGTETTALGFCAGDTGRMLAAQLREADIPAEMIGVSGGMTRINVKIKAGVETEINGRGPVITEEDLQTLFARLDRLRSGDALVLAGSLPKGVPSDLYRVILSRLAGRGILTVVDAAGNQLRETLDQRPFLIKPNRDELEGLVGRALPRQEDILSGAEELQGLGAENVLVSMGKDGAILLTAEGEVYTQKPPVGKVVNSVGAGDSMVAGFLSGWLSAHDWQYALKLGTAAGAATAFTMGIAAREEIQGQLARL